MTGAALSGLLVEAAQPAAGATVPEPGVLLDPQGNEFSVTE